MFRGEGEKRLATACLKMVRNKHNTPGIIKYPFWQMTARNRNAQYVCINMGEVSVPKEIGDRSIEIDADIYDVLNDLLSI